MKTNIETIQDMISYIDEHLEDQLDLGTLSQTFGYSKYHVSRMFLSITGMSLHHYIQRRRLTEAARLLVFSDVPIMEIAFAAGYQTQQSFTFGFKSLYSCSPKSYRRKQCFRPLQLPFSIDELQKDLGNHIMHIRTVHSEEIILVGYRKNTRHGFSVIGKCWHSLHAKKHNIAHRSDMQFLIGLNDYHTWNLDDDKQPSFDYMAAAETTKADTIPKGMEVLILPSNTYLVFAFKGKSKESLESTADFIYKEWLPKSTIQLNEAARYDFAKYGEDINTDGYSTIEYWIPILNDKKSISQAS